MSKEIKYSELLNLVEEKIKEVIPENEPLSLYQPFKYVMTGGGKRIRPILTLVCCGIFSNEHLKALNAAIALEILHNFTLVHDDIMDNSNFRRNRPTVHKKWNTSIAILTGDVMIGFSYNLLLDYSNHHFYNNILKLFTNEIIEVCEGQILDMDFNSRMDVSVDEYFNMIDKKTARLIETSCCIGAIIGEANENEVNAIKNISKNIGIAFQIQDDLLDMVADESKLGKKVGNDLMEGKKTLLILKAKELATDKKDKEFIEYYFNNNGLKENEILIMDLIFQKYQIYDIVNSIMEEYFKNAEKFYSILKENQYKRLFIEIIENIKNRKF